MSAHNQVRLEPLQVLGGIEVSVLKDAAVVGHHGFVSGLFGIVGLAENVVAGEGDASAVDHAVNAAAKLGLPGHPIDGEFIAFPGKLLARLECAVDRNGVNSKSVGGDWACIGEPLRVFELFRHAVERPDFRAHFSRTWGAPMM